MAQIDYSLIMLSDRERKIFEKFKVSDTATLTREEFRLLREKGLVAGTMSGASDWFDSLPNKGVCKLSDRGRDLRSYQMLVRRKESTESVRYWITTVIAILALILAVVSLITQTLS